MGNPNPNHNPNQRTCTGGAHARGRLEPPALSHVTAGATEATVEELDIVTAADAHLLGLGLGLGVGLGLGLRLGLGLGLGARGLGLGVRGLGLGLSYVHLPVEP